MADALWSLDASCGELLVRTGVCGRAAKMGHRLTIAMASWRAEVSWSGEEPTAVRLTVAVDSLRVVRGEGGLMPLSAPEKTLVRSNALKCLHSDRYPNIRFQSGDIAAADDGYRLTGTLEICGRVHPHVLDVRVADLGDAQRICGDTVLRQSEYGVRPYSMLMGSMQVADDVTVSFSATRVGARNHRAGR
ncbi:MAG: YceI family protein [Mycobacterium sp.]